MTNIVPLTNIDKDGKVHYRRRKEEDLCVRPYNPQLLLHWDACMKVEFISLHNDSTYILQCLHLKNDVTIIRKN